MEIYRTSSPVLFLIFNRPGPTHLVFEKIRLAKPSRLFIASDGPRDSKDGEKEIVEKLREDILDQIDWDCEVNTLFREKNLGCGKAVYQAIDWFFSNVQQGIILEDDCLPTSEFFSFCDKMLDRYSDKQTVFSISGTNLQGGNTRGNGSYYFSNHIVIWGWASWARAWKHYDFNMSDLDQFVSKNTISKTFSNKLQQKFWNKTLENSRGIDTWDYQWLYSVWKNNGSCIVPNSNLITNIGFDQTGTHTFAAPAWYEKMSNNHKKLGEIKHPESFKISVEADDFLFVNCIYHGRQSLLKKFAKKILSMIFADSSKKS